MVAERIYHELAEAFLFEKYSLNRLEERFLKSDAGFVPGRSGEGPKFFSLCNLPNFDRLSDDERIELSGLVARMESNPNGEEAMPTWTQELGEFVSRTYQRVLFGSLAKNATVMYFDDIYDRGVHPGNAFVFVFFDAIIEDEDPEVERRKRAIFQNVKKQFEQMVENKGNGELVRLIRL